MISRKLNLLISSLAITTSLIAGFGLPTQAQGVLGQGLPNTLENKGDVQTTFKEPQVNQLQFAKIPGGESTHQSQFPLSSQYGNMWVISPGQRIFIGLMYLFAFVLMLSWFAVGIRFMKQTHVWDRV